MAESATVSPRNADELIDVVLGETDPHAFPMLSITKNEFFNDRATQRRTIDAVAGVRGQLPTAMDSRGGSLLIPTILVVVNAIVAGVLGDGRDEVPETSLRLGWLARRRLARRLRRDRAPGGAETPLPVLSVERVARVLAEVRLIAVNAGLPDGQVESLCTHLGRALDRAAGRS